MKLTAPQLAIAEASKSRAFQRRLAQALHANPRGELFGIADEFGVNLNRAKELSKSQLSTPDELELSKSMRKLLRLMRRLKFQNSVIQKILRLHIKNKDIIATHRPSPDDKVSLQQLHSGRRLASMVNGPIDDLIKHGYKAEIVPWSHLSPHGPRDKKKFRKLKRLAAQGDVEAQNDLTQLRDEARQFHQYLRDRPLYYISPHADILQELVNAYHTYGYSWPLDLLHGLVFGYPPSQIYQFIQ